MPWTSDFQDTPPITVTDAVGGRLGFLQMAIGGSGPNTTECTVAQACEFPLSQVFATEAKNAINVDIPIPPTVNVKNPSVVVGAPTVSFTYSGVGNAKAVYAQVVDNATGQVLGNIVTPIPVTLDGKTHTIDAFPIANIAYTAPGTASTLTLQIVGNATLYANGRFGSVNISDITVELPTTGTAVPNPIPGLL
jgi:ABC-2 type transport system ATP-binding protein